LRFEEIERSLTVAFYLPRDAKLARLQEKLDSNFSSFAKHQIFITYKSDSREEVMICTEDGWEAALKQFKGKRELKLWCFTGNPLKSNRVIDQDAS